ncbi:MAG: DUF4358 domain-containing protein [Clostridiales bacterium]|nr:DUF4358 domain-containing protein [Clostridiales bacterium]
MYKKTKILLAFSFIMLVIALSGKTMGYKDIPLEDIKNNVMSVVDNTKFVEGDNKSFKRFYGLNMDDYKDVILYLPSSTMEVSELLIIKVNDTSQIDSIEECINKRIESQENSFKDYAPEQYSIIKQNEISIKGNYVFLAISENGAEMKEKFIESIK